MTFFRSLATGRRTSTYTYTELDPHGRPVRHIELDARTGTYLAAGAGGHPPPADASEMDPDDFDELWRRARCYLDGRAEVQIHRVEPATPEGLPVVVRCVGGRVRVGTRLTSVRETFETVTITVARIICYGRDVPEITPLHTATLILAGVGHARVHADLHLDGFTD